MQLRQSPSSKKDKERIRNRQKRNKILIRKQGKQLQRSKNDRNESITVNIIIWLNLKIDWKNILLLKNEYQ
ncbi:MAG: hypothetical protein WB443_10800 [Nitrososphaeraceae archaeon]